MKIHEGSCQRIKLTKQNTENDEDGEVDYSLCPLPRKPAKVPPGPEKVTVFASRFGQTQLWHPGDLPGDAMERMVNFLSRGRNGRVEIGEINLDPFLDVDEEDEAHAEVKADNAAKLSRLKIARRKAA